jgi:GLPGLI family protein
MVRNFLLYLLLLVVLQSRGQQKFLFEGKIEYERKINVHRQVDPSESSDWFTEFVKKAPPFHTSQFVLQFKDTRTIYKLADELPRIDMVWLLGPAKENIVVNDLERKTRKSHKTVFEKRFIVTDTVQQFKWKITDETRTIAGMECRKAVTIICDSVYVVAFYTDEIPVSGGPESFSGLPGMILGLAIPRLHTTWFATRVVLTSPTPSELELTARGQMTDEKKLMTALNSSFKDWGKYRDKNIWWILL